MADDCRRISEKSGDIPGELLFHPVVVGAMALVVFNTFVMKVHFPGVVSGKLSDFGLLVFAPVWLHGLLEWGTWLWTRLHRRSWAGLTTRPVAVGCCLALAVYMTALQLSPGFARFHVEWLSMVVPAWNFEVTPDPTDLIALPLVVIPYQLIRRRT